MAARKPIVSIGGVRKQLPDADVLATVIPVRYNFLGAIVTSTGAVAYEFDGDYQIVSAYFYLQTASSSGSVVAVPRVDGSSLGTLTAAASATRSNKIDLTTSVSAGSRMTVDITGAGTGADSLCLVVLYKPR